MRMRHRPSRRRRILWIGIALFCLLFQQLAMAAYTCTAPNNMSGTTLMTGDCAGMAATGHVGKALHQNTDPRCIEHCASHVPAQADLQAPTVPPLILPFASPLLLGTVAMAPDQAPLPDPTLQAPEAPPSLRFCTLLI